MVDFRKMPQGMENTERAAAGTGSGRGVSVSRPDFVPVKQEPKWTERKGPEFIEFKGEGESVEGKLLDIWAEEIEDKQTHQKKKVKKYLVRNGADAYEFIGTWDINKKISNEDIGLVLRVTFKGEKDVGKGNRMKEFEVLFAERASQDDGRPEITDRDIPF